MSSASPALSSLAARRHSTRPQWSALRRHHRARHHRARRRHARHHHPGARACAALPDGRPRVRPHIAWRRRSACRFGGSVAAAAEHRAVRAAARFRSRELPGRTRSSRRLHRWLHGARVRRRRAGVHVRARGARVRGGLPRCVWRGRRARARDRRELRRPSRDPAVWRVRFLARLRSTHRCAGATPRASTPPAFAPLRGWPRAQFARPIRRHDRASPGLPRVRRSRRGRLRHRAAQRLRLRRLPTRPRGRAPREPSVRFPRIVRVRSTDPTQPTPDGESRAPRLRGSRGG